MAPDPVGSKPVNSSKLKSTKSTFGESPAKCNASMINNRLKEIKTCSTDLSERKSSSDKLIKNANFTLPNQDLENRLNLTANTPINTNLFISKDDTLKVINGKDEIYLKEHTKRSSASNPLKYTEEMNTIANDSQRKAYVQTRLSGNQLKTGYASKETESSSEADNCKHFQTNISPDSHCYQSKNINQNSRRYNPQIVLAAGIDNKNVELNLKRRQNPSRVITESGFQTSNCVSFDSIDLDFDLQNNSHNMMELSSSATKRPTRTKDPNYTQYGMMDSINNNVRNNSRKEEHGDIFQKTINLLESKFTQFESILQQKLSKFEQNMTSAKNISSISKNINDTVENKLRDVKEKISKSINLSSCGKKENFPKCSRNSLHIKNEKPLHGLSEERDDTQTTFFSIYRNINKHNDLSQEKKFPDDLKTETDSPRRSDKLLQISENEKERSLSNLKNTGNKITNSSTCTKNTNIGIKEQYSIKSVRNTQEIGKVLSKNTEDRKPLEKEYYIHISKNSKNENLKQSDYSTFPSNSMQKKSTTENTKRTNISSKNVKTQSVRQVSIIKYTKASLLRISSNINAQNKEKLKNINFPHWIKKTKSEKTKKPTENIRDQSKKEYEYHQFHDVDKMEKTNISKDRKKCNNDDLKQNVKLPDYSKKKIDSIDENKKSSRKHKKKVNKNKETQKCDTILINTETENTKTIIDSKTQNISKKEHTNITQTQETKMAPFKEREDEKLLKEKYFICQDIDIRNRRNLKDDSEIIRQDKGGLKTLDEPYLNFQLKNAKNLNLFKEKLLFPLILSKVTDKSKFNENQTFSHKSTEQVTAPNEERLLSVVSSEDHLTTEITADDHLYRPSTNTEYTDISQVLLDRRSPLREVTCNVSNQPLARTSNAVSDERETNRNTPIFLQEALMDLRLMNFNKRSVNFECDENKKYEEKNHIEKGLSDIIKRNSDIRTYKSNKIDFICPENIFVDAINFEKANVNRPEVQRTKCEGEDQLCGKLELNSNVQNFKTAIISDNRSKSSDSRSNTEETTVTPSTKNHSVDGLESKETIEQVSKSSNFQNDVRLEDIIMKTPNIDPVKEDKSSA